MRDQLRDAGGDRLEPIFIHRSRASFNADDAELRISSTLDLYPMWIDRVQVIRKLAITARSDLDSRTYSRI